MLLPRAFSLAVVAIVFLALRSRAFAINSDILDPENNEGTKFEDWYKWLTNNNSNSYYDLIKPAEAVENDINDAHQIGFNEVFKNVMFPGYLVSDDNDTVKQFEVAAAQSPEIRERLQGLAESLENLGYDFKMPFSAPWRPWGKRSALRAALQAGGRRRRDPEPHAPSPSPPPLQQRDILLDDRYPHLDHGSLNNIEHYFGALHGSLHSLSAFPPGHRPGPHLFGPRLSVDASLPLYEDNANGMLPPLASARTSPRRHAPAAFLHSLRPEHLRTFKRRSGAGSERVVGYRGANFHDPALLWVGLGR